MSRQAGWRAAANALPQNVQGMGWMILAGIIFVSFNAVIRHVSSDMHPMQAAFLRYIFGLIFLAPTSSAGGWRRSAPGGSGSLPFAASFTASGSCSGSMP